MIAIPPNTKTWVALGTTDMRNGFNGLALKVQEHLKRDPFCGHLFIFRGRRGDFIKALWWDGQGFCLFSKRLEQGLFKWPTTRDGAYEMTSAQLSMLLEGLDWRLTREARGPVFGICAGHASMSFKRPYRRTRPATACAKF